MHLTAPPQPPGHLVARSIYDHKILSMFVNSRELVAVLSRDEAARIARALQSKHGLAQINRCTSEYTIPTTML